MRSWQTVFVLLLIAGFGLMVTSHLRTRRIQERTRWAGGAVYVAERTASAEAARFGGRRAKARFLPLQGQARATANALSGGGGRAKRAITRLWQEKLILFPEFQNAFQQDMLQSGRLPKSGLREVLAGSQATQKDQVTLEGEAFRVAGVLRKEEALFSKAYILPLDPAHAPLFDATDENVKQVIILSRAEVKKLGDRLSELFPRKQFTPAGSLFRLDRGAYYAYLLGMLLLCAGGSALMISGFVHWSGKSNSAWLAPPLGEIRRRKRLFLLVHVVYFGLCLIGMLFVYELPELQNAMLALVGAQVESGSGLLGIAGRAYASGNIALAAAVTLGINFVVGSFVWITLPSAIIPGIGVLGALFRALVWGILLAPTFSAFSGTMLPHSLTLLLEGEGYILASFFAILIPLDLCRAQAGTTVASRYGRALVLNLKGSILVLLVLAVAAVYEATEVILQKTL